MRPDGHRGEGPGRKKLDPRSNSSRMLRTAEAGPAEGINTQTEEAGWSDLSITGCLHCVCKCVVYTMCVCVCVVVSVCICRCVGEERETEGEGRGLKKRKKGGEKFELGLNNLQLHS